MAGEDGVGPLVKPADFPWVSLDGEGCPSGERPDRSAGSWGLAMRGCVDDALDGRTVVCGGDSQQKVVKVPTIAGLCLAIG